MTDVERWERERILEALDSHKRGLSEAPKLRKWWAKSHKNSDHITNGQREMTFVVSTDEVDRHGDSVSVSGWHLESYRKNPVVLWAHHYSQPAVGRALKVWTDEHSLLATIKFAPTEFAQEVATLYDEGFQSGVSVGFKPLEYELRRDTKTGQVLGINFTQQELLEISAAPVPANQNALKKSLDSTPRMQGFYRVSGTWNIDDLQEIIDVLRTATN